MFNIIEWLQSIQDLELSEEYKLHALLIAIGCAVICFIAFLIIIFRKNTSKSWIIAGLFQMGAMIAAHFEVLSVYSKQYIEMITIHASNQEEAEQKAMEALKEMFATNGADLLPSIIFFIVGLTALILGILFISKYKKRFPKGIGAIAIILMIARVLFCSSISLDDVVTESLQIRSFVLYCIGMCVPFVFLAIVALFQKRYLPSSNSSIKGTAQIPSSKGIDNDEGEVMEKR